MTIQSIPPEILEKTDRILFVAHLALGDFTYMEACFRAFHRTYPHIKIDLWVDELRRTYDFRQWDSLKNYSLFSWLDTVPFFSRVYKETYSPFVFLRALRQARQMHYPVVVSFGLSRRTFYARMLRKICKDGFVAAIGKRYRPYDIFKRTAFERLDVRLVDYPEHAKHVSQIYASWFEQLFGLQLTNAELIPSLEVPTLWQDDARQRLQHWGLKEKGQRQNRVIFINPFSKQNERSWPVEQALQLIAEMRQLPQWHHCDFILNTLPEKWDQVQAVLDSTTTLPSKIFLFSATDHFFQLPAMLAQCDLIISVETAVMHLANAVKTPVVALMRQLSPEWVPIDAANSRVVWAQASDDWVKDITVQQVIAALPEATTLQW